MINNPKTHDREPTPEEREQFNKLFLEQQDDLLQILLADTGNEHLAEDAKQATYIRGVKKFHKYDQRGGFLSWIARVGKHIARDLLRASVRDTRSFQKLLDERYQALFDSGILNQNPPVELMGQEKALAWAEIREQLDDDCRKIFELRFDQGMTIEEIANETGVCVTTVRNRIEKIKEVVRRNKEKLLGLAVATSVSSESVLAQPLTASSTTAGGPASTGSAFSIAAILSGFGTIFVWLASVWYCFRTWGRSTIENAPTLELKRWFLKHFMILYCGIVFVISAPFAWYMFQDLIQTMNHDQYRIARRLVFAFCGAYVFLLGWRYRAILRRSEKPLSDAENKTAVARLQRTIISGIIVSSIVFLFSVGGFIVSAAPEIMDALAAGRTAPAIAWVVILSLIAVSVSWFHIGTARQFLRFLAQITHPLKTRPDDVTPTNNAVACSKPWVVGLVACMLLTLMPSVMQLLYHRDRVPDAGRELIGFCLIWLLVYCWNRFSEKDQRSRILIVAVIQILAIIILRDYLWLPL